MDEPNQLLGVGLSIRVLGGILGGCRRDGGLIVEAIKVAARLLEVLDPFLGLHLT